MKKFILDFLLRGMVAAGFGPIVLAILYLILQQADVVGILTVNQVCIGIFSITALAFIVGGMNAIYKIERLPLMVAISIHGAVLYVSYLCTYLLNDWLEGGLTPILVFSGIFVIGYIAVWVIIYSIIKRNTKKVNEMLIKKQQNNP